MPSNVAGIRLERDEVAGGLSFGAGGGELGLLNDGRGMEVLSQAASPARPTAKTWPRAD